MTFSNAHFYTASRTFALNPRPAGEHRVFDLVFLSKFDNGSMEEAEKLAQLEAKTESRILY